mgnify:CR=1 FL=1|jgi:hypothetical protein
MKKEASRKATTNSAQEQTELFEQLRSIEERLNSLQQSVEALRIRQPAPPLPPAYADPFFYPDQAPQMYRPNGIAGAQENQSAKLKGLIQQLLDLVNDPQVRQVIDKLLKTKAAVVKPRNKAGKRRS